MGEPEAQPYDEGHDVTALTDRYTGPGRRGASRPLTDAETATWQAATRNWHNNPPWTAQAEAENLIVRDMVVRFYEDGVALPVLAASAGWKSSRVAGILHRARAEGKGTGSRRYIVPAAKAAKPAFRRPVTAEETQGLTRLYQALPMHASGARGWKSEQAQALLAEIDRLNTDAVALDTLGTAIGVSRQAVHQHLSRYRRNAQDRSPALV